MNRVAVAGERRKLNVVANESCLELLKLCGISEQNCGIAVILAGVSAGTDLSRLNAERLKLCKCLVKRILCVQVCKNAEFHCKILRFCFGTDNGFPFIKVL